MRKEIYLTICLSILSFVLYAQSDFRPGYIITNDDETVQGFIDYRGDYINCNKCVFKTELEEETVTYKPGEIKSYRFIDSKYYVSKFIQDFEKDVFLEYLIDGIVDVFYYKDITKEFYFVSKNGSELYSLTNEKIEKVGEINSNVGGQIALTTETFATKSNKHIGVLRYLFSDSKATLPKVNSVGLNHRSLINISNSYHNDVCSGEECIIFEKQLPPVSFEFEFLYYLDFTSLDISNWLGYNDFVYNTDMGHSFGLGVTMHPSRFNEKLDLYLQILYCSNEFSSGYIEDGLAGLLNYYNSEHEISYLNSKLGFKYTFPKIKIRPEILFAYTNRFTLSASSEKIVEEEMSSENRITNYTDDIINVNYNGISIGAGLNILQAKKIALIFNVQYEYVFYNLSGTQGKPKIDMNSTRIGLGIRF
jgi:hypothetical protein